MLKNLQMFCCCAFTIPQKKNSRNPGCKVWHFSGKVLQVSAKNVKNRRIFVKFGMRRKLWLWYDKKKSEARSISKGYKKQQEEILC